MRMNKLRVFVCFLAAVMTFSLCACGRHEYRDDVPLSTLSETARGVLSADTNYLSIDVDYLGDYFQAPDYLLEGTILRADVGNNLDEIGIFHVTGGNASAMKRLLSDYLARSYEQNRDWYDSYIPHETPKLRDAEVRVMGNYVAYAVLSPDRRESFFTSLREALTASP